MRSYLVNSSVIAVCAAMASAPAFAQEAPSTEGDNGEIIVTAQKRAQTLAEIPQSISSIMSPRSPALALNNRIPVAPA